MDEKDFELPPLPPEADIPMDLSDMENNPVEAPPAEIIRSTGRYSEEDRKKVGSFSREPFKDIKRLDEIYSQKRENEELIITGKKNLTVFCVIFAMLCLLYLSVDFSGIAIAACFFEILLAVMAAMGSRSAKSYLTVFFIVNIILNVLGFTDAFAALREMFEKFERMGFMTSNMQKPDIFIKAAYIAAAVFSAAAGIYLTLNKAINEYLQNSRDFLDKFDKTKKK